MESPLHPLLNLRDLPRYLTASTLGAAVVAALMAFTGPTLLILQAATAANFTAAQLNSWIMAVAVGGGCASLVLALLYRQPICGAWSIAGAALLVSTLPRYRLEEAVGAYVLSGLLMVILALTGLFGRMMDRIPQAIVFGMLSGVLFRFAIGIFTPLAHEPVLVLTMIAAFLVGQHRRWTAPALSALLMGTSVAIALGRFQTADVSLQWTRPEVYIPEFSGQALLSLSVPLALLALSSQNAPGIGILWAHGYTPPSNAITLVSGLGSILTALFGGHGVNIAAPMTAICSSPSAYPDSDGRYVATVLNGLILIAFGLVGATATSVMLALPGAIIGVVAGLAMVPVLVQSLRRSVGQEERAYGAFFALVIAASDLSLFSIGAPFWSLVGGLAVSRFLDRKR